MTVSTATPLLRLPFALLAAVGAGLLLWLAFPPVGFGPSAAGGVALLTAALWRARLRRGLGLGLLTGVVFFALLLEWMRVIGPDAWLLLTLLCASWIALLGVGTALVTRLPLAPVWVGAVWVLDEALRARLPLGGFPWGNLAFGAARQHPGGLGERRWHALRDVRGRAHRRLGRRRGAGPARRTAARRAGLGGDCRPRRTAARGPAGSIGRRRDRRSGDGHGGPGAGGHSADRAWARWTSAGPSSTTTSERRSLLAEAIDAGTAPQPDFVLWPENSSDIDPFSDPTVAEAITGAARAVGAPILVGAVTSVPGNPQGVWNVGIVWDPEAGPTQMYIKTHPVPFGEYVPFREQLAGLIGRFDRVPRDFLPGAEPGNLDIGGSRRRQRHLLRDRLQRRRGRRGRRRRTAAHRPDQQRHLRRHLAAGAAAGHRAHARGRVRAHRARGGHLGHHRGDRHRPRRRAAAGRGRDRLAGRRGAPATGAARSPPVPATSSSWSSAGWPRSPSASPSRPRSGHVGDVPRPSPRLTGCRQRPSPTLGGSS